MDFGRSDYNNYFKDVECSIGDNEPVFMLRGLDPETPGIMMEYCKALMLQGSFEVAQSVFDHVKKVISYQQSVGTKNPDLVRVSEEIIQAQARIQDIITDLEVSEILTQKVYDQLLSDMELAYGKNSLVTLLPSDFIDCTDDYSSYTLVGTTHQLCQSAKLVITPNHGKWRILKNTL